MIAELKPLPQFTRRCQRSKQGQFIELVTYGRAMTLKRINVAMMPGHTISHSRLLLASVEAGSQLGRDMSQEESPSFAPTQLDESKGTRLLTDRQQPSNQLRRPRLLMERRPVSERNLATESAQRAARATSWQGRRPQHRQPESSASRSSLLPCQISRDADSSARRLTRRSVRIARPFYPGLLAEESNATATPADESGAPSFFLQPSPQADQPIGCPNTRVTDALDDGIFLQTHQLLSPLVRQRSVSTIKTPAVTSVNIDRPKTVPPKLSRRIRGGIEGSDGAYSSSLYGHSLAQNKGGCHARLNR
ncbi:unnamed protein product [Protopolystoma xenopodis]|uniref:Uncharacterized protein n=1 Tax=Protopolystoma xenopodis TaxID=117903 RepID=A0A448XNQ0_9PLAT|nr:unnamed protein product [Protopolystoma xenopodis]